MSSVKEKAMKRKLFGSSEPDERGDGNVGSGEKKRRRKNVEVPKHYPLSERQQLAMLMQMTSAENSPEPASPPPTIRKTPGSNRKDKVHRRNERGETPLHLSTIRGDLEAMKDLIRQGAEVNVQDFAGWTPLHEACNHGHQDITRYLLEVGANVNSRGLEDDTPLHDAVTNSHRDLVELLLKHGANPLLANRKGKRPLDIAEDDVIRELMEKEVMSSDDSDFEGESYFSPKDSEFRKDLNKVRTTGVSSSSKELFKTEGGKQKRKSADNDSGKTKSSYSFSRSSMSSSSDTDDSDNLPLIQKKENPGSFAHTITPHSNGYKQKTMGKTPTLTATPVRKRSKSKLKSRHKKAETNKPQKITLSKSLSSGSDTSSDEFTSDSEYERVKKNGYISLNKSAGYKKNSPHITPTEKKNHSKDKSLYSPVKHSRLPERKSSPQSNHKMLHPSSTNRTMSYSSEEELPLSKVKNKSQKSENKAKVPASQTPLPRSNSRKEYQDVNYKDSKNCPDEADESVYDFSLSTEDSTSVGGIRLKPNTKVKDKASELWDSLCLGKPSEENREKVKNQETLKTKSKNFLSTEKDNNIFYKSSNFNLNKLYLDKNSNEIGTFEGAKTPKPPEKVNTTEKVQIKPQNPSLHSTTAQTITTTKITHSKSCTDVPKQCDQKPIASSDSGTASMASPKTAAEQNVVCNTVLNSQCSSIKVEQKPRKKSKDKHSASAVPNSEKVNERLVSQVSRKPSVTVNKEPGKTECSSDSINDKPKASTPSGKSREVNTEKELKIGSGKKKKKQKHSRSSNDLTACEVKERARRVSSESSTHESSGSATKSRSKSTQDKVLHKTKSDSSKSAQIFSRKSSQDSKSDTGSLSASPSTVRKKSKSCENTEPEVPKSLSKGSNSAAKLSKQTSGSTPDGKHQSGTPNSTKKDKNEPPKKIALLSDSSFFTELEKSSRQRELEKKMKLKRKKKLLQQKLKARKSAGSATKDGLAAAGEKKTSQSSSRHDTKFSELSADYLNKEKPFVPPHASRPVAQPMFKEHPRLPGYSGSQNTSYLSVQNLKEHDRLNIVPNFSHHSVFKSPSHPTRSFSQIDETSSDRHFVDAWDPSERTPYGSHEKRHMPVHRSLSFSGQPPDGHSLHSPARNHLPVNLHPNNGASFNNEIMQHRPAHMKPVSTASVLYNHTGPPVPAPHMFTDSDGPLATPHFSTSNFLFERHAAKHEAPVNPNTKQDSLSGSCEPDPDVSTGPAIPTVNALSTATTVSSASSASTALVAMPVTKGASSAGDVERSSVELTTGVAGKISTTPRTSEEKIDNLDSQNAAAEESAKTTEEKSKENEEEEDGFNEEAIEKAKAAIAEANKKREELRMREELELKKAHEKYVKERLSKLNDVIEEPMPKKLPAFIPMEILKSALKKDPVFDRLNVYEEWAIIQKQINDKRKKYAAAIIVPETPRCYWKYITFKGGYLLSGSQESWLSVPVLAPPSSLSEEMQALFVEHEKERTKLHLQHVTQRDKLIVACEQESIRVHSRAARTLQNQVIPLSACSVLLDREVYNLERRNKKVDEGDSGINRTAAIRDRFNPRMFLSWLQDVEDKYKKMKKALLKRQRHEAQALHAVQRTEWLLKLQEADQQGQQRWSASKPEDVTELHVPLVHISDDFTLLPG